MCAGGRGEERRGEASMRDKCAKEKARQERAGRGGRGASAAREGRIHALVQK